MLHAPLPLLAAVTGLALATTWILVRPVASAARRQGHLDQPGERKSQAEAVPYVGLALAIGFWLPVLLGWASLSLDLLPSGWADPALSAGARRRGIALLALLGGAGLLGLMGRCDDRRDLKALPRFLFQCGVALVVAALGVRATLFLDSAILQLILSALWLVFVTNATNFIDNMDALCPGASLAAVLAILGLAALDGQWFVAGLAAALAGALLGFLPGNLPAAKHYLGDEGSQFLGFALGGLALLVSYQSEAQPLFQFAPQPLLVPIALLILPVADGLFVITRRLSEGRPPWTPGQDHLSHVLSRRIGPARAVALLVGLAFLVSGFTLAISRSESPGLVPALVGYAAVGGLLVSFIARGTKLARTRRAR